MWVGSGGVRLQVCIAVRYLRWHARHSAEANENINMGYSQDQGYS